MAKIRARNALKILLDVHGDFGRRSAAFAGRPLSLSNPRLSSSWLDKKYISSKHGPPVINRRFGTNWANQPNVVRNQSGGELVSRSSCHDRDRLTPDVDAEHDGIPMVARSVTLWWWSGGDNSKTRSRTFPPSLTPSSFVFVFALLSFFFERGECPFPGQYPIKLKFHQAFARFPFAFLQLQDSVNESVERSIL